MGFKFNPFTGALDQTGSTPSSYIDGEVATYNDLPLDGTAPLNSAWLVREASGIWPVSRKQAGIYIRTATAGSSRDADYTYAGTMPDVFSDSQFLLYDNSDTSKNLAFDLSGISTGTTRTLTVPNASGRLQVEGQPIGNTTPSTGAFTTLSASSTVSGTGFSNYLASPPAIGGTSAAAGSFTTLSASTSLTLGTSGILSGGTNIIEQRNTTSAQTFRIYNTVSGAADANFERGFMRWSSNVLQIGTEKGGTGSARALEFQLNGTTRAYFDSTDGFGLRLAHGSVTLPSNGTALGGLHIKSNRTVGWPQISCLTDSTTSGDTASIGFGVTTSDSSSATHQFQIIRVSSVSDCDFRWMAGGTENLRLRSNGLLTFQGITSSFPAIKRSSAILQARLADDSGYTVLDAQLRAQGTAPATSGAAGTAGDIRYDADYIYVCTAANTWKRAAIATW